jgi:acetolactate synthase-1/2/3 large subunit
VAAAPAAPEGVGPPVPTPDLEGDLAAAAAVITQSSRPVILAGLGARSQGVPAAVRSFAERFGVPVLTTYKAKGVLPEDHIWSAGLVTNGALEGRVLDKADAIVTVGFETVELMPGTWPWPRPTVAIGEGVQNEHIPHEIELRGGAPRWLEQLERTLVAAGWTSAWTTAAPPSAWLRPADVVAEGRHGVSPVDVARIARELAPAGSIATVDAGSHMFAATQFWLTDGPFRFLISNGLATMGYALPAAIGASLASPGTIVVCFTGDGGLAMVTGRARDSRADGSTRRRSRVQRRNPQSDQDQAGEAQRDDGGARLQPHRVGSDCTRHGRRRVRGLVAGGAAVGSRRRIRRYRSGAHRREA